MTNNGDEDATFQMNNRLLRDQLPTSGATFTVSFSVTVTALDTLANPRSGGLCQADPNSVIPEENESNNDCTDTVIVNPTGEIRGFQWLDLDANGSVSSNEPFLSAPMALSAGQLSWEAPRSANA